VRLSALIRLNDVCKSKCDVCCTGPGEEHPLTWRDGPGTIIATPEIELSPSSGKVNYTLEGAESVTSGETLFRYNGGWL